MYKGKILISNYTLVNDLEFNKAVILIAKSDNEGTIGFILNKKSNYLLSDINSGSKELNIPIYKGGPVMIDTIHFIHKKTKLFQKSTKITNEIFWGNAWAGGCWKNRDYQRLHPSVRKYVHRIKLLWCSHSIIDGTNNKGCCSFDCGCMF